MDAESSAADKNSPTAKSVDKAAAPAAAGPNALPAFEPSLARIEEIVRLLGDGRTDLETALARYEEGVTLLRHCHELLRGARRRIEMLRGVDAEGRPILDTMDESDFRTQVGPET